MSGGLQGLLVTTITAIIVGAIMSGAQRKSQPGGPEVFTVRQSGGALAAGIVCMLVFAAFLLLTVYAVNVQGSLAPDELPLIFGVFGFFFLLGAFVTLHAARWEIRADSGRLEYTPTIGRTQLIRAADIAYVVKTATKLKAYDGWHHKIFVVDGPVKNRMALESWLLRNNISSDYSTQAADRARGPEKRRQKVFLPAAARKKTARLQKDREARRHHYMTAPPDLPDNLTQIMQPLIKTSLRLKPGEPDAPCAIGCSKFGGQPDLPPDFKWDYYEGEAPVFDSKANFEMVSKARPLAFLLQINCRQAHGLWPDSPLPRQGLLSFFYELDTMLWGPECLDSIGYVKVHYFENTEALVPTPLPQDLKAEYRVPQHPVVIEPEVSLPRFDIFNRGRSHQSTLANHKLYDQARASLGMPYTGHGELGLGTRMLGWAESIQNDIFDDFSQHWLKERTVPDFELARLAEAPEAGWELLLQLDSDVFDSMGIGSIMFGDSGSLYFGIRSDDLRAKRFDKAWFTLQCY